MTIPSFPQTRINIRHEYTMIIRVCQRFFEKKSKAAGAVLDWLSDSPFLRAFINSGFIALFTYVCYDLPKIQGGGGQVVSAAWRACAPPPQREV